MRDYYLLEKQIHAEGDSIAVNKELSISVAARVSIWLLLCSLAILRIVGMVIVPLADTTEARYGEIARKMAETGDWITPQFEYGVPFWAKPPLSTWLSALGIKIFGECEFAVRFSSLLLCIGILALVWHWVKRWRNRDQALVTVCLLSSTVLFFASAGAVMTDASLGICTTLAMIAFWNALHVKTRVWNYGFFVAIGLGFLAKGPLILVLTVLPIGTWILLRNDWVRVWQSLPWFSGSLLACAICLPWYIVAELKSPGFLEYFIVGEHINRFLHPGWSGDKYGHAHAEPLGTIWLFWLYAAFPFSFIAIGWVLRHRHKLPSLLRDSEGWTSYLLLWSISSLLFFTIAGNIIWTYAFTSLPAFAVLAIEVFRRNREDIGDWRGQGFVAACGFILVGGLVLVILYGGAHSALVKKSQRDVVDEWLRLRADHSGELVYYQKTYQSALFYSHGQARTIKTTDDIYQLLHNRSTDFLAVYKNEFRNFPVDIQREFEEVDNVDSIKLYKEKR